MMTVMRSLARRGGFPASARTVATGLAIASFVTLCMPPVAWMLGVSFIDSDGGSPSEITAGYSSNHGSVN